MDTSTDIHKFSHQAMDTEFHLSIAKTNPKYAGQAAINAFRELDIIEGHLSRYIEHSDISRINNLSAGESTIIDPITFECLKIAADMKLASDGAFDIAYASQSTRPLKHLYRLDGDKYTCQSLSDGLEIDLGGIGKGFALDKMAELLSEWDLDSLMLRASYSTVLALSPPADKDGWQAGFGDGDERIELLLDRQALAGSGIVVQGEHIVDQRNPGGKTRYRAWALSSSGARADALSTAFMIMGIDSIEEYIRQNPTDTAWIKKDSDSPIQKIGLPPVR